jgi:hypothetical protein
MFYMSDQAVAICHEQWMRRRLRRLKAGKEEPPILLSRPFSWDKL